MDRSHRGSPAQINFNVKVSNLALISSPLTVQAVGGFSLGNDPLDDAATDPPILSATQTTTFTPTLFTITKVYNGPENETATGPDYPRSYTIDVSIANGQTINNFNINDVLPPNAQFVSVTSVTGNGTTVVTTPSPDPTGAPDGTVTRQLNHVLGTGGATDAQDDLQLLHPTRCGRHAGS